MLQQPYPHDAPAFSAGSPGYAVHPAWHSAACEQQLQSQAMHSRPYNGPQELYQPQPSAARSQRSGHSVPVQPHHLEYDQAPTQVPDPACLLHLCVCKQAYCGLLSW